MERIEVAGMIYEFEDELHLMELLDEMADRVYEETAMERTPPNDPLTLEELREMDGEPVFCFSKRVPEDLAWGIVCIRGIVPYVRTIQNKGEVSRFFYLTTYGTAWLAYRRKPEEGTTWMK